MFQRPGNQTVQVVVKQRPGCFGIGCGGIIAVIVLLVVVSAANGGGKATPTPGTTFLTSVATATALSGLPIAAIATPSLAPQPNAVSVAQILATATGVPTSLTSTPSLQFVTVKEDAVNLRQSADVAAAVVTLVPPDTDATVIGEDQTGPDGVTRYVHARVGNKEGYLRSDLVSAPHVAIAASVAPSPAPTSVADSVIVPTATIVSRATSTPMRLQPTVIHPVATTGSTTIAAWYSRHSTMLTTITDDLTAASDASGRSDLASMGVACRRLGSDVRSDMTVEPIPDADAATHFGNALRYFAAASQDCVVGAQTLDVPSLERSSAELQLTTGELGLATAAIRKSTP